MASRRSLFVVLLLVLDIVSSRMLTSEFQQFDVVPKRIFSEENFHFGQVGGLASHVQNPQLLYVFHRASREWNAKSFPDGRHFDQESFAPIEENTILLLNTLNGQVVNQWGNHTFSMPHGLSSDTEGNLWLTDVAMHQVLKYSPTGQLLLTLGEAFVPGDDEKHFCKPTDVAVSNDRSHIYVADGYCNSRVVKFDSKGKFLREYSIERGEDPLVIPHSVILIETLDLLCVADRENGRIVCFDIDEEEGQVKGMITDPEMKTVYALTLDVNKHRLYAVSGGNGRGHPLGFTFSVHPETFGELLSTWRPDQKFGEPHDLALSVNGRSLFVGEIHPNRIDSFDIIN